MKINASAKGASNTGRDMHQHRPVAPALPDHPQLSLRQPTLSQRASLALQAVRFHVAAASHRRAPQRHAAIAPAEPPEVVQALAAYEAARNGGSHPAFDLHGNGPQRKAFIKERDQGGVDLWVFSNSEYRHSGVPCIEHLYWPRTAEFHDKLFQACRDHADCPKGFSQHQPATEALLGYLGSIQLPVETIVGWCRTQTEPRPIAYDPAPGPAAPGPPEVTHEQALVALEFFKNEGLHRAWEISAGEPRRQGWIKRGDVGGVALMAVNNSYARLPHEPRVQMLYWQDEAPLAALLYQGLKHGKGCPHPLPGQLPDIEALLNYLQQSQTPLEPFLEWCSEHTAPHHVAVQAPTGQGAPAAPTRSGQTLVPDGERQRLRQVVDAVRLVDRVNAPLHEVVACAALLDNIADANEDWIVLGDGPARARLELDQMRIGVDVGDSHDALFIWLSPDRTRVVDITGHPEAAKWGLQKFPAIGLLRQDFVSTAPTPQELRFTRLPEDLAPKLVMAHDVQLVRSIAGLHAGRPRGPIAWDASEADTMLPMSLSVNP